MAIYILGDIHAEFKQLNTFINKKRPELILQCGDFGYWPNYDGKYELGNHKYAQSGRIIKRRKWYQCSIKNETTNIYFCDGNHEDHASLRSMESQEVCPKVFYMKRSSYLTLPDGRNVLFVGGAQSIDKSSRTCGKNWFPEEVLAESDLNTLPDVKIDIVVSHTCPKEFIGQLKVKNTTKFEDPSHNVLSSILKRYKPQHWYFAHFHIYQQGITEKVKWTALNQISDTGWFIKLPKIDK